MKPTGDPPPAYRAARPAPALGKWVTRRRDLRPETVRFGRRPESGYPHPQERLGLRLPLLAGSDRGTAHGLHLRDDRVRGVADLHGDLPRERSTVLASRQYAQP